MRIPFSWDFPSRKGVVRGQSLGVTSIKAKGQRLFPPGLVAYVSNHTGGYRIARL